MAPLNYLGNKPLEIVESTSNVSLMQSLIYSDSLSALFSICIPL